MNYILRQAAWTAGCFVILYALALGLTYLVAPSQPRTGTLDVWDAGDTLYLTSPKYAFLGRDALDVPDRKVIVLGASNAGLGFKQAPMQALVPCAKVSDLAIGSANITEMRQMIDLVHEVQSPEARRTNTFVIGVWFGDFADTEARWPGNDRHHGDTDLDIERYRYGFDRRTAAGPVDVLPPRYLHLGVILIRPYLLLEKVARDMTSGLRQALFVRPPELTDAERETLVMSDKQKSDALAYWRQTMGGGDTISQAQVTLLRDTIEDLLQSGEKVVLVDLPIPAWHRDASPYQPSYAEAIQAMQAHFADRPGFASLRMPDLDGDQDYSDEVHAKPHLGKVWEARLAAVLNPLVCPARSASPNAVVKADATLPPAPLARAP